MEVVEHAPLGEPLFEPFAQIGGVLLRGQQARLEPVAVARDLAFGSAQGIDLRAVPIEQVTSSRVATVLLELDPGERQRVEEGTPRRLNGAAHILHCAQQPLLGGIECAAPWQLRGVVGGDLVNSISDNSEQARDIA